VSGRPDPLLVSALVFGLVSKSRNLLFAPDDLRIGNRQNWPPSTDLERQE
jgi:hypothetical protein